MRRSTGALVVLATAAALGSITALSLVVPIQSPPAQVASAQVASARATYSDIEATLGLVPAFFKLFPEVGIAGAWAEFKSVQLDAKTKLDGKTKGLIGLGLAADTLCQYCVYFHTAAAKANGATDEEIRDALAMAASLRHWTTVLNGVQVDVGTFKHETDTVLRVAEKAARAGGTR